jgi:hypothetical protein
MTQIILNIPENEVDFFMKLIDKFKYESTITDFSITPEMKNILDERRKTPKENFIPWEEAKKQLEFKSVK